MDYIGEHLLPGQIGHLLVILSFVASIIATVAYFISARATNLVDEASWKKLGRAAFFIDVISVLVSSFFFHLSTIIGTNTSTFIRIPATIWNQNIF